MRIVLNIDIIITVLQLCEIMLPRVVMCNQSRCNIHETFFSVLFKYLCDIYSYPLLP